MCDRYFSSSSTEHVPPSAGVHMFPHNRDVCMLIPCAYPHALVAVRPAGALSGPGSMASIASGRLSYTLGFQGPCLTIDVACSSSLAACHAGFNALQQRECVSSLAAGVTVILVPENSLALAIMKVSSAAGRCFVFDIRADGYVRGEACAAIVLAPADEVSSSSAQICGSASRQDGRSASLTAPSGVAQHDLFVAALSRAGVQHDALLAVEVAANGSSLGDPIEARSVAKALLPAGRPVPLILHNFKGYMGHGEHASGVVALAKVVAEVTRSTASPNAQLRVVNRLVYMALEGKTGVLPSQQTRRTAPLLREAVADGGGTLTSRV
jgi:acyl transferase domain-containing protein